jgi:hypothetical protein
MSGWRRHPPYPGEVSTHQGGTFGLAIRRAARLPHRSVRSLQPLAEYRYRLEVSHSALTFEAAHVAHHSKAVADEGDDSNLEPQEDEAQAC